MKKINIILLCLVLVAVVVIGFLLWSKTSIPADEKLPLSNEGIRVTFPKPNEFISSPLKIGGIVNGNGWTGFEGQVGTVKLFDASNKELALGILTATEDWMQFPTNFETTLFFDYPADGTGRLVFYNENASGDLERDRTFSIPIKLTKSSSEKTVFNIYFGYPHDLEQSCELVFPFKREVMKTSAVAKAAIEELLKGPSASEVHAGYITSINSGVKLQNLVIEDGIAKVDFNKRLEEGVAGSCRVLAIRSEIERTLKQFSTVKSVIISVNGETEQILQP